MCPSRDVPFKQDLELRLRVLPASFGLPRRIVFVSIPLYSRVRLEAGGKETFFAPKAGLGYTDNLLSRACTAGRETGNFTSKEAIL